MRDLVIAALKQLGGIATLQEIYDYVSEHGYEQLTSDLDYRHSVRGTLKNLKKSGRVGRVEGSSGTYRLLRE